MLGTCGIGSDERQIDVGLAHVGKLDFRFLRCLDKTLGAHFVRAQVDAVFAFKLGDHPIHYFFVEIVAAQMSVAVRRFNLEKSVGEFQNRYVEGTAAQVENQNRFVAVLVQTVGKRCRRRLVDDTLYVKSRDTPRIFCRLTLAVVEVCRNGDDRLGDGFAQIRLSIGF